MVSGITSIAEKSQKWLVMHILNTNTVVENIKTNVSMARNISNIIKSVLDIET